MFGRQYRCSDCTFDFNSGWSHHAGGQFLVCRQCAAVYVLGGGQSCWGARDGEELTLSTLGAGGDQTSTGMKVQVSCAPLAADAEQPSLLRLPPLSCPACGAGDALMQSFADGEPCPACKTGRIVDSGWCVY